MRIFSGASYRQFCAFGKRTKNCIQLTPVFIAIDAMTTSCVKQWNILPHHCFQCPVYAYGHCTKLRGHSIVVLFTFFTHMRLVCGRGSSDQIAKKFCLKYQQSRESWPTIMEKKYDLKFASKPKQQSLFHKKLCCYHVNLQSYTISILYLLFI